MSALNEKRTLAQTANALTKLQEQYTPLLKTFQADGQCYSILIHLLTRGSITQMEAVDYYRCYRLSARIADLREKGVQIETEKVPSKQSYYARYWLKGAHENDL